MSDNNEGDHVDNFVAIRNYIGAQKQRVQQYEAESNKDATAGKFRDNIMRRYTYNEIAGPLHAIKVEQNLSGDLHDWAHRHYNTNGFWRSFTK